MKKLILPNSSCKALICWGTNLGSTVGFSFNSYQRNVTQIPPFHFMVLVGLMLSDACIQKRCKNARLEFSQGFLH